MKNQLLSKLVAIVGLLVPMLLIGQATAQEGAISLEIPAGESVTYTDENGEEVTVEAPADGGAVSLPATASNLTLPKGTKITTVSASGATTTFTATTAVSTGAGVSLSSVVKTAAKYAAKTSTIGTSLSVAQNDSGAITINSAVITAVSNLVNDTDEN